MPLLYDTHESCLFYMTHMSHVSSIWHTWVMSLLYDTHDIYDVLQTCYKYRPHLSRHGTRNTSYDMLQYRRLTHMIQYAVTSMTPYRYATMQTTSIHTCYNIDHTRYYTDLLQYRCRHDTIQTTHDTIQTCYNIDADTILYRPHTILYRLYRHATI